MIVVFLCVNEAFSHADCMSRKSKKKCFLCLSTTLCPLRVNASSPFWPSTAFLRVRLSKDSTKLLRSRTKLTLSWLNWPKSA